MAGNTPNLDLYYKNPATDGNDLFDIESMLNDNWDKIDAAVGGIDTALASASTEVQSLKSRLNTGASTALTLARGTLPIPIERDKPFNLTSIIGRMLLNLLGRTGNFESLTGWSFTGGSGALNTSNVAYGFNSLLFTLSATSGRVSRSVTTTVGKTYVAAVEARIGTASNATIDVTGFGAATSTATSAANFQISFMRFTATATSHSVGVTVTGANGQTAYIDGLRVYEVSASEYNALTGMTAAQFSALYPYTEGLAGVKNPYAIRWTDSGKTDIAALLAFDTELLAAPVPASDAEKDMLNVKADGSYYKTSAWRKLILSGDLTWRYGDVAPTGFKQVASNGLVTGAVAGSGTAIKYDGKIIPQGNTGTVADSQAVSGSGDFFISIPQADSGWGDSYTPTAAEIKAYFYGYKMYDSGTLTAAQAQAATSATYNGSGTKQWVNLVGSPVGSSLPITLAPNFTPYELMYKRATAITEPVSSEGAMSFVQGNNTIEVGSGLVIRESVRPQPTAGYYWINGSTPVSSALKDKTLRFISVYRNGRPETWSFLGFSDDANKLTFGYQQARILADQFSAEDTYSVTYLPLRYYPVADFVGSTPNNEKAILDDLTNDIQQLARRVSVTELKKVDKGSLNWIVPTVVGGWNPLLDFAYRIEGNRVYFRGILSNGATAAGTLIFTLPERVRTPRSFTTSLGTYSGSAGQTVAVDFFNNGQVKLAVASALAQISFEGFSYALD